MSDLPLERLMNPRSIAVVGASERADAIGTRVIKNLRLMGYRGRIHPVNPRYGEIAGLACFPSLAAIPECPDAAFLAVPAAQGPALMDEAAACGIRAVFINANGYADGGAEGVALQRRVEAVAKAHGIALAGPNNLGLVNVHDRAAIWTPRYMGEIRQGPLALVSQSGSIAIALAEDERRIGFAYLVTTGNEAVLGVADYLGHFARDERVGVILLYLETIRNPAAFAAAAEQAIRHGKRIVALKLGSSEDGRALVQAHTGSLAGEDRLYDSFFKKLGIHRVRDLDEMLETAVMLAAYPTPPPAADFVAVTLSGGEAALIADVGHELGIDFAPLSAATVARLRPAFPPYATIRNPLDAWGLGFTPERFKAVLEAIVADPAIGTIAFSVDAPGAGGGDVPYACIMAEACVAAARASGKRLVFFNNVTGTGPNGEVRAILDRAGIPFLSGIRTALAAIGHYVRPPPGAGIRLAAVPSTWSEAALGGSEVERFRLLAEAGLPMAECVPVASAAEAVEAAARLGYPVVLKGSARELPHKSDRGLVRLGLGDRADVAAAYDAVAALLAKALAPNAPREIYLQPMAAPGVELILGVRNEPGFGSFVVAGIGGIFVEVIAQASLRLGPVDEAEALAMLRETPAGRLLAGARGKGPYDTAAAARALAALSQLGAAALGTLASLEINPLIVHETGVIGVDVLIEAAAPAKQETAA
ncbi:MAG TPA: acetate--CoA ligase family protein [Alphaproteobacteria bacterium]|nr:acetate--CoA ligase family protein [Alphaproteobacteria bacterium]